MNWNEINVYLAPIGSQVRVIREVGMAGEDHSAPAVVRITPPPMLEPRPVHRATIELWFETAGFRAAQLRLESSRYEWEDVSAAIVTNHGLLASILFSFKADASLRERMLTWDDIVGRVCEANFLEVVNPAAGLAAASEFQKLVERSFAWGYFIEMEKWRRFG
jgi:hypothetical protein